VKVLLTLFLFLISLNADEWIENVHFSDYELNASLYLCNYYSYQDFKDLRISSTTSKNLVNDRVSYDYGYMYDVADVSGVGTKQLDYIRRASHLIDWNTYTNDFGMTLHQTNFIYALLGALFGFLWISVFTYLIIREV